jgi:hypothetical protein
VKNARQDGQIDFGMRNCIRRRPGVADRRISTGNVMRIAGLGLLIAGLSLTPAGAQESPVVVELFTSQGCSSCPPADAFLTDLAHQAPGVLPLAFHVTYWDSLGWKDPYSLGAATARQRDYARTLGRDGVYTPQMIVDGVEGFVGSDRSEGLDAIARAARNRPAHVAVGLTRAGDTLVISVGAGSGTARVLLIGFDPAHRTHIGRGENSGRTVLESNIVRSLSTAGVWSGAPVTLRPPPPPGEATAVLLQSDDGRIIGAARLNNPAS